MQPIPQEPAAAGNKPAPPPAAAVLDENRAKLRQRWWTHAWLLAGYVLDVLALAIFFWAGAVPAQALATYLLSVGAMLGGYVWWSFRTPPDSHARMVLDSCTRLGTMWLLFLIAWLHPATAFYFFGLVLMLLCITHRRASLSWARALAEWAAATLPTLGLVLHFGAGLIPPIGTAREQLAVTVLLVLLLARGAILGHGDNRRRSVLAHFKQRYRELSANLEDEVVSRTRELGERNAALAEVNRQQQAIASSVAHEFRQPIITVAGHAGALKHQIAGLDARHGAQLDRIVSAARDMEAICDGIQRIIAVERADLRPEDIDLGPLIRSVAHSRAAADRITVEAPDCVRLHADPHWLRLALESLLVHMQAESGADARMRIQAGRTAGGVEVVMECPGQVPDSGVGFALAQCVARRHGGELRTQDLPGATRMVLSMPA
jgi:signal transduction histidine kinase